MADFIDILKKIRAESGLSQEAFGKTINMQRSNYWGVEKGIKFLTEEQLRAISELYGFSYEELYRAHEEWEISKRPEKEHRVMDEAVYLPVGKLLELLEKKIPDKEERTQVLMDYLGIK